MCAGVGAVIDIVCQGVEYDEYYDDEHDYNYYSRYPTEALGVGLWSLPVTIPMLVCLSSGFPKCCFRIKPTRCLDIWILEVVNITRAAKLKMKISKNF